MKHQPDYLFITHLHPDHAYFIEKELVDITIPVFAPERFEKIKKLHVISDKVKVSGFEVIPVPVIHSKYVKSFAYIIEKKHRRILYTGDMVWIEKKHHHKFGELDLVITDGSFIQKKGMVRRDDEGNIYGHQGIPQLVNLFKKFTRYIIFTHFGNWFYHDIPSAREKIRALDEGMQLEAAYDGMETEI